MTIQQLEYIVALDKHRHFVSAADACFVTQPTLTMQLKKLEEEIGVQIFNRSTTPLEPTSEGEVIIMKARNILSEVRGLREMISTDRESMQGSFKIGIIPTLAPYLLPLFLKDFSEKYPKTQLHIEELKTEDIIDNLLREKIDIGLLSTPVSHKDLREIQLCIEPFVVYAHDEHELHRRKSIDNIKLPKKDLWLLNEGHCFRNQVIGVCGSDNSSHGSIHYESGSLESIKNLVKTNGGYTLLPEMALSDSDKKYTIPFKKNIPGRELGIAVHKSFVKERLLENLHDSIVSELPEHYVKDDHFIRVKWH